ncbi:hypothetical protein ABFS83_10G059200 [Erythranthe nasuta]
MAKTIKKSLMKFTCSGVLLACTLPIALQIIFLSLESPSGALEIPPPSSVLAAPSNGKLQEVIKLGEGVLKQPEDVAVDKLGVLYTATRDGFIKRLHKNGTLENWRQINSDALLGLTVTAAGDLIVCDADMFWSSYLFRFHIWTSMITKNTFGSSRFKILHFYFADDVVESSDGVLYFSVASTKHGFHNWQLDAHETKHNGQLVKYDPLLNVASVVLHNLGFANGVALSADQDFLVVCETWKYRCLKHWVEGDLKEQTDIFIDNLPGAPDNINLAPDGSFWIALIQLRPRFMYVSWALKYVIRVFPKLGKWMIGRQNKAMVVNIASDGSVVRSFDDPTGKVMSFVTSTLEFEGYLYFGSLQNDFIGKLPLTTSSAY